MSDESREPIAEYDVEREIQFNRENLGTRIPNRLEDLRQILKSRSHRLEAWHANLFTKLLYSVGRMCLDLSKTTESESLPVAAWNARNLLELSIWIRYCSVSGDNSWRFYEDALRDVQGLVDAHSKLCAIRSIPNELEGAMRTKIRETAVKHLGIESVDSNYTKVVTAAESVGLGDWYRAANVFLSKFAHPTAGLVVGTIHQNNNVRFLQSLCTTQGLYFAGECVSLLEEIVLSIPDGN